MEREPLLARPDRPSPQIEITPEMIEAGCSKLLLFDSGEDDAEARGEIVAAIYRVMSVAAPDHQQK